MNWDSATFWPTLVATFIGVILSFLLTFAVYWIWDHIKTKRQKEITKYNLSIEITDNQKRLKNYERTIDKVRKGNSKSRILFFYFSLQTVLYKAALQSGEIYKLHDKELQKDLYEYATQCECFNSLLGESKLMFAAKFGINSDIPKEIVETFIEEVLPDLMELMDISDKLQKLLLGKNSSEVSFADKQINSDDNSGLSHQA